MEGYLTYLNSLKGKYIETRSSNDIATYVYAQFHYYQGIKYDTTEEILFWKSLYAVKLINTSIVFVDQYKSTRVYFTDRDIRAIVVQISDQSLKDHIIDYLNKAIKGKGLSTVRFTLGSKTFKIKGIPFKSEFNSVACENPADIDINGNDIIGLINLVLEKDRADKSPHKLAKTARFYMS